MARGENKKTEEKPDQLLKKAKGRKFCTVDGVGLAVGCSRDLVPSVASHFPSYSHRTPLLT